MRLFLLLRLALDIQTIHTYIILTLLPTAFRNYLKTSEISEASSSLDILNTFLYTNIDSTACSSVRRLTLFRPIEVGGNKRIKFNTESMVVLQSKSNITLQ